MKTKFTLILLVLTLSLCVQSTADAQVNVQDSLALVDLYNSTDGPHWTNHTNWLTTEPVLSWYGISKDLSARIQINLSNNNLSDTLPSSLGDFSRLLTLNLSYNKLNGKIPSSFGNFS